ncbi:hypothetical protein [Caulobacter hibisci]|uniref:Uncharacterized protein n=1 Tax=Caulobacter hibisci TaxID=2035993 RepID=A0ABS0SYQ5_9CAUL|nr:hypothetical protein [Caulobacter hibisci]MBI1684758.1 hypothetical protein [Caulobacter hibisci]
MLDSVASAPSRQTPPPSPGPSSAPASAPASPPPSQTAVNTVHKALESGFFNPITHDDVKTAVGALTQLDSANAKTAIETLAKDGSLDRLAAEVNDGKGLGLGGLSADEKRDFFNAMAKDLGGSQLKSLSDAFAKAGGDYHGKADVQALGQAVATHAASDVKVAYVQAQAGSTLDHTADTTRPFTLMGSTQVTSHGDAEAAAVGDVLASLKGDPAAAQKAFDALSPDQLRGVLDASIDRVETSRTVASMSGAGAAHSNATTLDATTYKAILEAGAQSTDADFKARLFAEGSAVLKGLPDQNLLLGISSFDRPEATRAMAEGLTSVLKSDVSGVMRELAFNAETRDGTAFATYAKQMLNDKQTEPLADMMQQLQVGGAKTENPIDRFEAVTQVTLPNGQAADRYENAAALGHYVGGVQAAAASITTDQKAQAELISAVLKSGLTILDKSGVGGKGVGAAAAVAKEWVTIGTNAALKALQDNPAATGEALDLAAVPTDPRTGEEAVGSNSKSAYNTALNTVARQAKP